MYGSVFFFGSIEQPKGAKKWILRDAGEKVGFSFSFPACVQYSTQQVSFPLPQPVRVGVNFDGIHVINDEKHNILLSLPYDAFSYNTYQNEETYVLFTLVFATLRANSVY
jgi:hypothetical protein